MLIFFITESINSAASVWGIKCLRYEIRKYWPESKIILTFSFENNLCDFVEISILQNAT